MPVPANISDLSTTAGSNPPTGSETPQEGDNHLRAAYSFIRQISDRIDGTTPADITVDDLTVNGALAGKLASAAYTPTYSSQSQINTLTHKKAWYIRVGNFIEVTVVVEVNISANPGNCLVSLPVASNLPDIYAIGGGTFGQFGSTTSAVRVQADSSSDAAVVQFPCTVTGVPILYSVKFGYEVI